MTAIYLVGIGEDHLPRYDYECNSCHYLFEVRQSFDDEPVAKCPECQSDSQRKISVVPIVFKGSGWYVNDYGKRGASTGSPNDSKSSSVKESQSSDTNTGSETNTGKENKSDSTKTQSVAKKETKSKSSSSDAKDG